MDLEFFVNHFRDDPNLGRAIALYIIAPRNLSVTFQGNNYFRAGVAGSRETQNIDRSITASGAESRASSLISRASMYHANWIAGGTLVAALVLPDSVKNTPRRLPKSLARQALERFSSASAAHLVLFSWRHCEAAELHGAVH